MRGIVLNRVRHTIWEKLFEKGEWQSEKVRAFLIDTANRSCFYSETTSSHQCFCIITVQSPRKYSSVLMGVRIVLERFRLAHTTF